MTDDPKTSAKTNAKASTKEAPGRPRIYHEPRYRLTIELPTDLVRQMDAEARPAGTTRTAWIEAAVREKLTRDK